MNKIFDGSNMFLKLFYALCIGIASTNVGNGDALSVEIDSSPDLVGGQNYYEFLGLSKDATVTEIESAIDSEGAALANKLTVLQALAKSQIKRDKIKKHMDEIKKHMDENIRTLARMRDVLTTPYKRKEYNTSLGFYRLKNAVIADKLSRPIVEFSPKATLSLDWKIELTNSTDEYLYVIVRDFILDEEIAPLARSRKPIELAPKGLRHSVARINNIELPDSVNIDIYDGSDRDKSKLISSHNISGTRQSKVYVTITKTKLGKRILLLPTQEIKTQEINKTPSGLDASRNIKLGNIIKVK